MHVQENICFGRTPDGKLRAALYDFQYCGAGEAAGGPAAADLPLPHRAPPLLRAVDHRS